MMIKGLNEHFPTSMGKNVYTHTQVHLQDPLTRMYTYTCFHTVHTHNKRTWTCAGHKKGYIHMHENSPAHTCTNVYAYTQAHMQDPLARIYLYTHGTHIQQNDLDMQTPTKGATSKTKASIQSTNGQDEKCNTRSSLSSGGSAVLHTDLSRTASRVSGSLVM